MYNVSDTVKNAYNSLGSIKKGYLSIVPLSNEEEIIINESKLKSFTILDEIHTPSKGFAGSVIAKELNIKFYNDDANQILNREVDAYIGVDIGEGVLNYVPYGRYIVQKPEENDSSKLNTAKAFDYMIKFNVEYSDDLTYPCTLKDVLQSICEQADVELGTEHFTNENFVVENNQFVNSETCRTVLSAIAQLSFTYARIGRDNKLYLGRMEFAQETFSKGQYYGNFKMNNQYGPINQLVIGMSQVDGENVTIKDDDMIAQNGVKQLSLLDNPFTYTQQKREQVINELWNVVRGFTYMDFSADVVARPYLDCGDTIGFERSDGHYQFSYIQSQKIEFNGGLKSTISATAETETENKYAYESQSSKTIKNTQIIVDKNKQEILAIVEDKYSETEGKINKLNVDLEGVKASATLLGGNNLQRNSLGAYGTNDFVQSQEGSIIAVEEENTKQYTDNGFGRMIYISNGKWFRFQSEKLKVGETYTLSFKFSNTESNLCSISLKGNISTNLVQTTAYQNFKKIEHTFVADTQYINLEVWCANNGIVGITDYYLQIGSNATTWQPASGEALSTSLELYYNGLKVRSSNSEIITDISNLGFTVENTNGKILITFNKDNCILSDTQINGKLEQNGWVTTSQIIKGVNHKMEVYNG